MWAASFIPFNCKNIRRCGSQTCPNCPTVLVLLSIEGSERCTFILGATTQICETDRERSVRIFEDSPLTEIHIWKTHLEKDFIHSISNTKYIKELHYLAPYYVIVSVQTGKVYTFVGKNLRTGISASLRQRKFREDMKFSTSLEILQAIS
jgi:hypothetical protein